MVNIACTGPSFRLDGCYRFGRGEATRVPVAGRVWTPRAAARVTTMPVRWPITFQQVSTAVKNQGVLVDVRPGHRSWRPPA